MTERFHITREDKTTVRCPQCHQTKTVDVAAYRHIEKTVKVRCRCTCGHLFMGVLDKRGQFRKETNLPGSYRTVESRCSASGLLTVRNISRTGLKLFLNANPGLVAGDSIRVKFSLDDAARSLVEKDVVVRKIDGLEIGTEFAQPLHNSSPGERALGFYLLS